MERADWDRRYRGTELVWTAQPNRFVVEELGELPPGRALDLGSGEGRNAVWLAEGGWQVTAVDFSSVALDKARRLAQARGVTVDWVLADLYGYRPKPGAYHLVLVAYLHLSPLERVAVLAGAVAALAPGGTLLVIGHDLANLTQRGRWPPGPGSALHPGGHRRRAGRAYRPSRRTSPPTGRHRT
jgi:SAM-dependent methyltransferase